MKTIMVTQERPLNKKVYDVKDDNATEDVSYFRKIRFPKMASDAQQTKK